MKRAYAAVSLAVILGPLAGCQTGPRLTGPVRAIWVVRDNYRSPEDVKRIMANCSEAGFNNVLFQVRGNGTVYYPSKIEPWSEDFDFASPGFDPLAVACKEAHARGLKIHAWVNVMPAWRGETPPACKQQLYHTHPEWFWYDQQGRRQPLNSFYVSLNPCLPEVRSYLVEVFRELVVNYPVDGLHMDYIRFPNEPPAIPEGSGIDYPRDAETLRLYRRDNWFWPDPDANKDRWSQWRTAQVTRLVAQIRGMMRDTKPQVIFSASVGTNRQRSLDHFRDEIRWIRRGLIDAAFPMDYKPNVELFNKGLEMWMPYRDQVSVIPGLWFDGKLPTEQGAVVAKHQIASAVANTGNFCVFSYASLFDTPPGRRAGRMSADELARIRERGAKQREIRRREVLPYVRSLAKPAAPPRVALVNPDARAIPR